MILQVPNRPTKIAQSANYTTFASGMPNRLAIEVPADSAQFARSDPENRRFYRQIDIRQLTNPHFLGNSNPGIETARETAQSFSESNRVPLARRILVPEVT